METSREEEVFPKHHVDIVLIVLVIQIQGDHKD